MKSGGSISAIVWAGIALDLSFQMIKLPTLKTEMAKSNTTVPGKDCISLSDFLSCVLPFFLNFVFFFFFFFPPQVSLFSLCEFMSLLLFCHCFFCLASLSEVHILFFPVQEEYFLQPPLLLLLPLFLYFNAPWPNLSPLVSFSDSKASCTLWSFTFCLQSMKVVLLLWENSSCIIFPRSLKSQYSFGWNVFKWFLPEADHQRRKFNPK